MYDVHCLISNYSLTINLTINLILTLDRTRPKGLLEPKTSINCLAKELFSPSSFKMISCFDLTEDVMSFYNFPIFHHAMKSQR